MDANDIGDFAPRQRYPSPLPTLSIPTTTKKQSIASISRRSSLSSLLTKKPDNINPRYTSDIRDYELLQIIGGVDDISFLYCARHKPTNERVTLKYTDLSLSPDVEFIAELVRTISNTAKLRHPNILPYHLSFTESDHLWSVTVPLISGGSCRALMKTRFGKGFSEAVVASILKETLKALIYLHANHYIHNDIRADNVLIDAKGGVRLTGMRQVLCRMADGKYKDSVFGLVGDKIEWAAPEVIAQTGAFTEKADLYSFGVMALEMAFGRTPFDDWPPLKVLLCKMSYAVPNIDVVLDKVFSMPFYAMVLQCLQRDPKLRPSAVELIDHSFFKQARLKDLDKILCDDCNYF